MGRWAVRGIAVVTLGSLVHASAARADSTTTCHVDSWGDVVCTTTSSSSPAYGPVGRSAVGGVVGLTVLAGLVASLAWSRSDSTDTAANHETGLGIMVGVEFLPNPLLMYRDGDPPDPEVRAQWQRKVTVVGELRGGAVRDASDRTAATGGGRITVGRGRLGVDVSGEMAPDRARDAVIAGHLLLRAPPRSRAVIALAIGARRVEFGGVVRTGLDVEVPHSYVITHDDTTGAPDVVIVSRPGIFYGDNGLDVHLDLDLVVPVTRQVAVEVGGGVFSFDTQISARGSAGLALAL